jgi:hypothetical protein
MKKCSTIKPVQKLKGRNTPPPKLDLLPPGKQPVGGTNFLLSRLSMRNGLVLERRRKKKKKKKKMMMMMMMILLKITFSSKTEI